MDKKNKFKYKTANVIDNKEYKQINKQQQQCCGYDIIIFNINISAVSP